MCHPLRKVLYYYNVLVFALFQMLMSAVQDRAKMEESVAMKSAITHASAKAIGLGEIVTH